MPCSSRPRPRATGRLTPLLLCLAVPGLTRADEEPPATVRRAHEVSALLAPLEEQSAPSLGLVAGWIPGAPDGEGGVLRFEDPEPPGPWLSPEELQRWISGLEQQGGELRQGQLILQLAPAGHERVAAGLSLARAEARPLAALTIEVLALAPEHERALAGGAGEPLDAEALAALALARRGGRLAACQLLLREGERAAQAQLERTSFHGDREVNMTGIVPVLNPVLEDLAAGCAVQVAVSRLPGEEGRLLLDARLERVEREPLLREVTLRQAGKLQLPAASHLALAATAAARAGETILLGAARVPGSDARLATRTLAVTCRVDALPSPAPPAAPAGPFLRRYSLRAALPAPEHAFPRPRWPLADQAAPLAEPGCFIMEDPDQPPPGTWSPSELADRVMSEAAQGSWEDPDSGCWVEARDQALIVSQTSAGQAAVEAYLREQSAAGRRVQHELLVLAAPEPEEGAAPVAHVLDAAAWEALVRRHPLEERLLLAGQSGQRVEGLLRREQRVVVEVERLAGGDTAEGAAVVEDPQVETVAAGTHVALRARVGAEGELTLELDVDLRQAGALEQVPLPEGTFDRVVGARSQRLRQRALLAPGQGLAWELGTGPERRLLLVRARPLR